MRLHFKDDDDLRTYISDQVLTTSDVEKMAGVSRQRVSQMIQQGKFIPFKKLKAVRLFFRSDIELALQEVRSNRSKYKRYTEKNEDMNG